MKMTLHAAAFTVLALGATGAAAEPFGCTPITSAPFTISAPGVYCLTTDLSLSMASGTAISIEASSVTLDLGGHKMGNLTAGSATLASAVFAYQRQNITIRNGTIRGFAYGVVLNDVQPFTASRSHLIENIRLERITFYAIYAAGHGIVVRDGLIVDTGGSTAFGPDTAGTAIYVFGAGNRILNNDIATVIRQGAASGYGVVLSEAPDSLVVNNRITEADVGIYFADSSTGKFRDNLTSNVSLPFSGGTDAGNNN